MPDSTAAPGATRALLLGSLLVATLVVGATGNGAGNDDEDVLLEHANKPWTGDFDGMRERGFVRVLTAYDPFNFTYDGFDQASGFTVEIAREFEKWLTEHHAEKGRPIRVVLMPDARDRLLPDLVEGRGDIAIGDLTITEDRLAVVNFSQPVYPDVRELLITGPTAPAEINTLDDLVDTGIYVRASSSYHEHLHKLNDSREALGLPRIPVYAIDERLEDYDVMNMVNASVYPATVSDNHFTDLWAQLFENLRIHEDISVHDGGKIAWAMRKGSPELEDVVNGFVKQIREGSLLGNVLRERYLGSTDWIEKVSSAEARDRYDATIDVIKEYAERYDFDWLMIAAQAYQESKLDNRKRSSKGAVGIMQVMPRTAADPNVNIAEIEKLENNVHAGVKYLRFIEDRYFSDEKISPLDRALFSFAAYNAGPRSIARARKKAAQMGFDPNQWFGHVEVAAARTISREPVIYVRNVYKYYVAYEHLAAIREARNEAIEDGVGDAVN